MAINFNEFCKNKKCEHYVEWEYMGEKLVSCTEVGESENIRVYPECCPHMIEIIKYGESNR